MTREELQRLVIRAEELGIILAGSGHKDAAGDLRALAQEALRLRDESELCACGSLRRPGDVF